MKKTKLDVVPKRIHVRLHKFQSNCMKTEPFRTYTSINSTHFNNLCLQEVELNRKLKVYRKLKVTFYKQQKLKVTFYRFPDRTQCIVRQSLCDSLTIQ